ncbi:MAG: hypothetical protein ABI995_13905 [Acidobacteriota bacterium]
MDPIHRMDRRAFVNAVVIAVAAQAMPAPAEERLERMRPYSADGPLLDWHVDDMWGAEWIRPAQVGA